MYPQPLWSWRRANPGSTAARHTHTARSSSVTACSPSSPHPSSLHDNRYTDNLFIVTPITVCPPARPPARAAHTSPETQAHGCRCIMPLRTHAPPSARAHGGAGACMRMRTTWMHGSPSAMESHYTAAHTAQPPLHQLSLFPPLDPRSYTCGFRRCQSRSLAP